MADKRHLTNNEILSLAENVADQICRAHGGQHLFHGAPYVIAYPVPRGGIPAAYAVQGAYGKSRFVIVDDPRSAQVFIDDIVDSGETKKTYLEKYPGKKFFALIDKTVSHAFEYLKDEWIVFPWEGDTTGSVETNITRLLQFIGEDPTREGLLETPKRVVKAWEEWARGYRMQPADVLKTFTDGADGVDEMVIQRNIPFYSHCEHHLAPFFGTITIAYVPDKRIVGLSKLARLAYVFARRLQVQERLTNQIADALLEHLNPKGVGVVVKARHLCMESRGVDKQGCETVTSALRGVLKDKPEARAEFMDLAR